MLLFPFLLSSALLAYGQSPNLLGSFPLAVKTPYLHSWIASRGQTAPVRVWPSLYTISKVLGWSAVIRVDDQAYEWMGDSNGSNLTALTVASDITPSQTIFTIQTGPVKFNATFFSPIEPHNYTRQSIPFTYLFIDGFTADDTNPHKIQLYSHITSEWVSNDTSTQVVWNTNVSSNMVYHQVAPKYPKSMTEEAHSPEDATAYYATPQRPGLTWQTGFGADSRIAFIQNGTLANSTDTAFRAVNDRWPSLSFAIDLGSVGPNNQPDPVVWALGLVRKPLVDYIATYGSQLSNQIRTGYYWSAYGSINQVVSDFLGDFANARLRSRDLDAGILKAAHQVSPEYAGLVSLVTRQVFASMDITVPSHEGGHPDTSDVRIFMKDISTSSRVNPVEIIYGALPALLYFNPSFVHDLLIPLFEFQSPADYPYPYASPDLGNIYPIVHGNANAAESYAIEHSGNMLIIAYAHAVKSGDGSLISKYHPLLQKWADYLVQNSLHPNTAISADGYPQVSNLALKGILGVYSMGKIDEVVNPSNTTFKDKANELIKEWKQLAVTPTHIKVEYGRPDTWGLMYNLFPAIWLETGLIDDEILNNEASFYLSKAPPENESYSLDSESANGVACPHWTLLTTAIIPSNFTSTRDTLISSTYHQAYNPTTSYTLPMKYETSTGNVLSGTTQLTQGSAAQGSVFGILAMNMKNVPINATRIIEAANTSKKKKSPLGAIVGGMIGGAAFLLVISATIFFRRRHKTRRVVINPYDTTNPSQNPNDNHIIPVLFSSSKARHLGDGTVNNDTHVAAHIPPPEVLSSKQREVLQQIQSHASSVSVAEPTSIIGIGRTETLRAEVEELRREVEVMRNVAHPPPSYHPEA